MSIELKIKSKHLSEEARIIRFEERKLKKQIRWYSNRQSLPPGFENTYNSIHNHRVFDVRNENRATYLSRAFIAGKPYKSVEQNRKNEGLFLYHIIPRIVTMVQKYGSYDMRKTITKDKVKEWASL